MDKQNLFCDFVRITWNLSDGENWHLYTTDTLFVLFYLYLILCFSVEVNTTFKGNITPCLRIYQNLHYCSLMAGCRITSHLFVDATVRWWPSVRFALSPRFTDFLRIHFQEQIRSGSRHFKGHWEIGSNNLLSYQMCENTCLAE